MKTIEHVEQLRDFTGLVLFSAPWCLPCRSYKPLLETFALKHDLKLVLVDLEKTPTLAGVYEVRAVPTTFTMREGVTLSRRQGAQTEAALRVLVGASSA